MKVLETVGIILSFGGLVQLFKWILDSLRIKPTEDILTILIASIFSLQLLIILFFNQIDQDNKKIKEFLKTKGFIEERYNLGKMIGNKKGNIDSRILWIPVALIILYLFYKLFTS